METNTLSPIDRFNNWLKESVMIKLMSIGFLILILLIPSSWIESLINERQYRAADVMREISSKWSTDQTVMGPVLVIPFTKYEKIKTWEKGIQVEEISESIHQAYFLPEELSIDSKVSPQLLKRGIFDAVVYDSKINLKAKFGNLNFEKWNIPDQQIHWKEAKIVSGMTDLRGISENPVVKLGDKILITEPSGDIGLIKQTDPNVINTQKGIASTLNWSSRTDIASSFSMDLQLKGSERLYFVPAGKTTDVKVSGNWPSPSFDGQLLPASRDVNEKN